MTDQKKILERLRSLGNEKDRAGMARFGIETKRAYGVSVYVLRKIAKEIGTDHTLAQQLWKTRIHEAMLLASFIDDPEKVNDRQMERWVKDFDSWDVCDQCCGFLFDKTPHAVKKAMEWSRRKEEFIKRAGFVLMAAMSVHDKNASDGVFEKFFPRIIKESTDKRNFVKKAVNWALRQIGKRNRRLNRRSIAVARQIKKIDSPAARWIASDALRELTDLKTKKRLA